MSKLTSKKRVFEILSIAVSLFAVVPAALAQGDPACGVPGSGSCFVVHGTPGCDCDPCCERVCSSFENCCFSPWGSGCVNTALALCPLEDCDSDGATDECEIATGTSTDCDRNCVPDGCEQIVDCQPNAVSDACDITNGASSDCDEDGVPDECQADPPPALDCNNNNIPDSCEIRYPGPLFLSGQDADDFFHCTLIGEGTPCGGLYPAMLKYAVEKSRVLPVEGPHILVIYNDFNQQEAFDEWNNPINGGPGAARTLILTVGNINAAIFADYSVVYIASSDPEDPNDIGLTSGQLAALKARKADFDHYVNVLGGGIVALSESVILPDAYDWLPVPITSVDEHFIEYVCPTGLLNQIPGHTVDTCFDLIGPTDAFYHNYFAGPPGFGDLSVLAVGCAGQPVLLGRLESSSLASIGDCDNDKILEACEACPWDLNNNGTVNAADLALLLGAWGPCANCTPGQYNCACPGNFGPLGMSDCTINAIDLSLLLGHWGSCLSQRSGSSITDCQLAEALAELGFSSVEQFNDWTAAVPPVVGFWAGDALLSVLEAQGCGE